MTSTTMLAESDLGNILIDNKVRICNSWINVGLQLGLAISDLEKIGEDNHHKIDACKREMLKQWLRNGDNPTLEKLHAAIDVVLKSNKQTREERRTQAKNDATTAKKGIDDVKNVLDTWKTIDNILKADFNDVESNVTKEEKWMDTAEQWEKERIEWKNGEIAARRENIIRSLRRANFKEDRFVRQFLRNNGVQNIRSMSNPEIEAILRTELADIDIDRSRKLGEQFTQIKKHLHQLESLQTEIEDSKRVIIDRVDAYEHIIKRLTELRIPDENLQNLRKQLDGLISTEKRCDITGDKCSHIFEGRKGLLKTWKNDINEFNKSFEKSIEDMSKHLMTFAEFMEVAILTTGGAAIGGVAGGAAGGILGGVLSGAVSGALTGSIVPGPGTAVGLVVGGVGGIFTGIAAGFAASQSAKTKEQKVRNYQQTLATAQTEHQKLKELLGT